jgi:hypothetical protein
MSRRIPRDKQYKFKSCDEYDEEMMKSGRDHFNSYGDYVELNPPVVENDAVFFFKSLIASIFIVIIWIVRLALLGAAIWLIWFAWNNILS